MAVLVASLLILQNPPVSRYELGERLRKTENAWMTCKDSDLKRRSTADISTAVGNFFTGGSAKAALALDTATAKLESRALLPSDALNVRFTQPFSEPGKPLKLAITWSYRPQTTLPVTVSCAGKSVAVSPGKDTSLIVNPYDTMADLRLNPEVGTLIPVRVGAEARLLYLSYIRNYKDRIQRLTTSSNQLVRESATFLKSVDESPQTLESDLPLIQLFFQAEAIQEGKQQVADLESLLRVKKNDTIFRAQFPRSLKGRTSREATVVIALHGAGGSENMFFEAYGRGAYVGEAIRRGWVFVSPRASGNAITDVLAWMRQERNLKIGKVFIIGHSMGAGIALSTEASVPPEGIAVMAPAATRQSATTQMSRLFVAVGKQDLGMLRPSVLIFAREQASRPGFVFKEYDPSEHLMVVPEAINDVYRFFDSN